MNSFLELLKQELQALPTEEPQGSEDIYGQDISLSFFSDDFQWSNGTYKQIKRKNLFLLTCFFFKKKGGPEGCTQGESKQQASPEQKEKFKELVSVVKGLGEQYAITVQ